MKMKLGDLVRLAPGLKGAIGIVTYKHPTKEVARVHWSDFGPNWEKCARLTVLASLEKITKEV